LENLREILETVLTFPALGPSLKKAEILEGPPENPRTFLEKG